MKQRIAGMKNYSYTNARVRAMRGDLITDQEYRKLAKMELSEIAEFIGKRGYRDEIDDLGGEHSGAELVERAVRQNLANTYRKLMRISEEPVQELLSLYYRTFDIENMKIILRRTVRGGEQDVERMITPTPFFDEEAVERFMAMDDPAEVLEAFDLEGFGGDLPAMVDDPSDLAAVEDALDTYYYTNLVEAVDEVGVNSDLFREFLQLEAALANITLILRMTRRGKDRTAIEDHLIPVPRRHQVVDERRLLRSGDVDDIMNLLRDSPLGDEIDEDVSPGEVERALETYKLTKGITMMHRDQLGVNPVLGFMVCKEVEASNLRMIAQAKSADLGEEFIERNLVRGVAR